MAAPAHWLITIGGVGGTPTPPPPIPAGINVPNPGETSWTLGVGGAPVSPEVAAGWDLVLVTTLYNNGVALSYTPDPALEAVVWRGDDQPNAFFPQVTWISAVAGSLRAAIPASATAGLEPGHYRFRVGVTVQGVRLLAYDGGLDIRESAGSDALRRPYVEGRDLEFYYPQIGKMQVFRSDPTAFLVHRVDASDQFDRMLVNRYLARPGYARRRFPDYDPVLGYDRPDPTLAPPSKAQLTAWLAQGGYRIDPIGREMIARMAIALVLDRQETMDSNPYRDHGKEMQDRIAALWRGYQAQIDADLDLVPDWLIDTDATFLPAGAAP
jgi:hypothetical protein